MAQCYCALLWVALGGNSGIRLKRTRKRPEMVAEYHKYYGSAALMQVNTTHGQIAKKSF
jgi:hypothetical protein